MSIAVYESDDTTLVDDLAITGYEAGADSDVLELHIWNNKGDSEGQAVNNVLVRLLTESPTTSGTYLYQGLPPQDERWGRARIIGYTNTGETSWSVANTAWVTLGAYAALATGTIPANCAVHIELKMRPPSSADGFVYRHRVGVLESEYHLACPPALTLLDRGILTGVGDPSRSGLIEGGAVTPTGTPDDEVHVGAVTWLWQGAIKAAITADVTLNQNDSAAAALGSGESYWACLSLGSTLTTTKGTKGAAPTRPTKPAGELLLAWVRVDYGAGGSEIAAEDIDLDDVVYDRHLLVDAGGLDITLHPGQAIGGETWRWHVQAQDIALDDDATSYVWQLASGLYEVTTTATSPEESALGPWWVVTTASGDITVIEDRRTYAGTEVVLELGGDLPGSPGSIATLPIVYDRLEIDRLMVAWSDNGGGSSGSTILDLELDSTTLFTSSGTQDLRPALAFDAATLLDDGTPRPEVRTLRRGQTLELTSATHPTGGTPTSVRVWIICRKGA